MIYGSVQFSLVWVAWVELVLVWFGLIWFDLVWFGLA